MVRERAAGHGIDVSLEVDPELDTIDSDELRFKQVLLNLLSNAVKFTPDGGHVQVSAHRRGGRDRRSPSRTTASASRRKTASGSSSRSSRADAGAQSEEGTGLGLTLCRRIVALLGGTMWLETELGAGQHVRLHRADRRSRRRTRRTNPRRMPDSRSSSWSKTTGRRST